MTAIDTKKETLQNKITRLPDQVQSSRKDAIEKYLLALEMQDGSGGSLSDGTIPKIENLGIVKSAIKGKAASSSTTYANRHVGSYPYRFSDYSATDGLSGPSLTSFGFQFTPTISGTLTNDNCADYYMVSTEDDDGNLILCNMSEHGDAFSSPTKSSGDGIDLIISDPVNTQGDLPYTFVGFAGSGDYQNKSPIFQQDGSTLDVYVSGEKIAEINLYGVFTNVTNTIGVTIDPDTSFYNFGSGQLDLVFTALPTTYDAVIELKYTYVASSVVATTETPVSMSADFVFKFELAEIPLLSSVMVKVNGEQKAMIMDTGTISGMTVETQYSYYNMNTNVLKIRFKDINAGSPTNEITVDYTIKDEVIETSVLGSVNSTTLTYSNVVIPTANPDILEAGFEMSFITDYTEDTEVRTPLAVTLSGSTISGTYTSQDGEGVVTGTLTQATSTVEGSVSITLSTTTPDLANPPADSTLVMTFNHLTGRDDWEADYNYIDITSVSTLTSPVNGSVTMDKINIASDSLEVTPSLLSDYHVKSYEDHSVYGIITIICWGLQIDDTWTWYTGSASVPAAEGCMKLNHDEFVSLFGWMDLSNSSSCDIVASCDPDNDSNATETPEESNDYPNLYEKPFFPSTPPDFQEIYLYRDSYHKTKKVNPDYPDYPVYPPAGLIDGFDYSVNADIRWIADVMPSEDDMMDDTYTFTNPYQLAMDVIAAFTSANTTTIPQNTPYYVPFSSGQHRTTYAIDDAIEGFYIVYQTYYTSQGSDPYTWDSGVISEFTCYFNDMQHYLYDEVNPVVDVGFPAPSATRVRNITDSDSYQDVINASTSICQTLNYVDASAETTFYLAVDTFDTVMSALISYNAAWVAAFDTSSSSYAYTTTSMTNYVSASTTFSTAIDTELSSIASRMGTTTTAGYAKNLYDAINLMLALDIEYIKKLLEDFTAMESMFQTAVDDHTKWVIYNAI